MDSGIHEDSVSVFMAKIEEAIHLVGQMSEVQRSSAWVFWSKITQSLQKLVEDAVSSKEGKNNTETLGGANPSSVLAARRKRGRPRKSATTTTTQDSAKSVVIESSQENASTDENKLESDVAERQVVADDSLEGAPRRSSRMQVKPKRFLDSGTSGNSDDDQLDGGLNEEDDADGLDEDSFKCAICGKEFMSKSSCKKHEQKHSGNHHRCTECPKMFSERRNLLLHMQSQHSECSVLGPLPDLKCKICSAILSSQTSLKVHMHKHTGERPFGCSLCGKRFTTKANCQRHEFKHGGEKPFECPECKKCYTEKKSLKVHMRTHTGEKPYKCDQCDKAFTQAGLLTMHRSIHTGEKSHLCSVCGKAFRQRNQLLCHLKRHTNNRQYPCDVCPKSFVAKGDLDRHKLRHTGERPYLCNLCPKTFNRLQYLKEHLNVHTGKKPYKCKLCPEAFPDLSGYARHQKRHRQMPEKPESGLSQESVLQGTPITLHEITIQQDEVLEGDNQAYAVFQTGTEDVFVTTEPSAYLPSMPQEGSMDPTGVDSQPVTYMELVTVNFPGMNMLGSQVQPQY